MNTDIKSVAELTREQVGLPTVKKYFVPIIDNGLGMVRANFMECFLAGFQGLQIFVKRISDSHCGRAMNKASADFLASDCDEMIVIDSDIIFSPEDIQLLISHDLPIVFGAYPKRQPEHQFCLCTLENFDGDTEADLVEVRRAGKGFMRVKREVLDKMKEISMPYANHLRPEWDFFQSGVVYDEMSCMKTEKKIPVHNVELESISGEVMFVGYEPEFLSEDWYFCEKARSLGYKIMVDQRTRLKHEGDIQFPLPLTVELVNQAQRFIASQRNA